MTPFFSPPGIIRLFRRDAVGSNFLLGYQGNIGGIRRRCLASALPELCTRFIFGFGIAFLMPILLMILERAGIVTRDQLVKSRRYAIVASAAVAGRAYAARRCLDAPDAGAALRPLRIRTPAIRLTHWRAPARKKPRRQTRTWLK